jgi:hypothetical protein
MNEIVDTLLKNKEVSFNYKNHFLYVQERADGDYECDIYESKSDFENEGEIIDGGICETIIAAVAIQFFIDTIEELEK